MPLPKDPIKREEWLARNRLLPLDPEWRRKHYEGVRKLAKNPEWIQKHKEMCEARSRDPEWINRCKEGAQKRLNNPEWRRKTKRNGLRFWENYERSMKITESKVGGFWYGNVNNDSNKKLIYCELWNDVNPRVHAFFNYECCLCHVPENGKSHIGHHVFYVKQACCWKTEDGIYYTNLNARDHPEHDYLIGENPNYFVILCPSCHGRTNGLFANRKRWADYFKNMIEEKYNGRCYLTEEEMSESLR